MVPTVDGLRRRGAGHSFSTTTVPVSHDSTSHTSSEKGLTYPRAVGLAGIVLTLVACQATALATPTTTPESPQGGNPTLIAPLPTETVQNPAQIEATATPEIEISMPAPIDGLYYGSYGVDSDNQQVVTGAIDPVDFNNNNPNSPYRVPSYGNGEVQVNTLYSETNTQEAVATILDQKWLDGYFNAQTDKTGAITGTLPDGSVITKQGLFWIDSQGKVLNPIVRNIAGEDFGWPMLVVKDNQLFTAVVDGDGQLVGDEQFHPAFQKPSAIAESVGFDRAPDVAHISITNSGILQMSDAEGKFLGEVAYIGNGETFEERLSSAEYATPAIYDEVMGQYAKAFGLETQNIQLHTEIRLDKFGLPTAFQLDQNGMPLFILNPEGKWDDLTSRSILELGSKPEDALKYCGGKFSDPFAQNQSPLVDQEFSRQFNEAFLTDGWWFFTEPSQGNPNFTDVLDAATKAHEQGMFVLSGQLIDPRGEFMYGFLKDYPDISSDDLITYMTRHITQQMTALRGVNNAVIVVNEARHADEMIDGGHEDPFAAIIGEDSNKMPLYIQMAFQAARDADPSVALLYNDGSNWYPADDRSNGSNNTQRSLDIINNLKANNLIDGIGVQLHLNAADPFSAQKMIQAFQQYGIPVYITELDIYTDFVSGSPEQKAARQQELYEEVMRAIVESNSVVLVNHWNLITDDQNTPGQLFTEDLNPTANQFIEEKVLFDHFFKQ